MGALVAVGRIATKRQQRGADIVASGHRRMGIAEVITKQVATHRQFIVRSQAQQVAGQVIVIRPAGVLHRHAHRVLAGVLARGDRCDIDADKLTHIPGQGSRCAAAGFLGDGEQWVAVDQQGFAAVDDGLECGKQGGDTSLVVQVARADMAAFGELGQGVERHVVTDADSQGVAVGTGRAVGVQAQLHMVPAHRHFIHGGIECVP